MAHPHRDDAKASHADKLIQIVSAVPKPSDPWSRAERISGVSPVNKNTNDKPPVEAVPQFENDRSIRDVPYGSRPKGTVDD